MTPRSLTELGRDKPFATLPRDEHLSLSSPQASRLLLAV